jgi:predicted HD phosphohydrolase
MLLARGYHDAIGRRSSQLEDLRTAAFLHDVGHMTLAADGQNIEVAGHAEEGERWPRSSSVPVQSSIPRSSRR